MTDREKLIELIFYARGNIDRICNEQENCYYCPATSSDGKCKEAYIADHLIANGVAIPVHCKDCKHWVHLEDGIGDCTNGRFHLNGCADPTMGMDDFCSCGERKVNGI